MVAGHHHRGVERKVLRVFEDLLPGVERWHRVETTRNALNHVGPGQVHESANLPKLVYKPNSVNVNVIQHATQDALGTHRETGYVLRLNAWVAS